MAPTLEGVVALHRTWTAVVSGASIVMAIGVPAPDLIAQEQTSVNRVIEGLRVGEPVIGTFTRAARADLDFAVIDAQYGAFDIGPVRQAISGMTTADGRSSATPIVRIPLAERRTPESVVRQVLEAGALGVMFPDIETPDQAAAAVASMRPPGPPGQGGVWPLDRSGTLVAMIQIESLAGVERLEDILDVAGVGVIFLGPTDLATSLGASGPDAPAVEAVVQVVLAACLERDVPCGYPIVAPRAEEAARETARRLAEGFRVLAVMTTAR